MDTNTFRVMVIKSGDSNYWYNDHIGEVFLVRLTDEDDYIVMGDRYAHMGIWARDCVRVMAIKPYKHLKKHTI